MTDYTTAVNTPVTPVGSRKWEGTNQVEVEVSLNHTPTIIYHALMAVVGASSTIVGTVMEGGGELGAGRVSGKTLEIRSLPTPLLFSLLSPTLPADV